MKKKYIKPEMQVVNIKYQAPLLVGSKSGGDDPTRGYNDEFAYTPGLPNDLNHLA